MEFSRAEERLRRLECRINDDDAMLLEMNARVQNAKAQAAEAHVEALAAQPGYFSGSDTRYFGSINAKPHSRGEQSLM